MTLPSQLYQKTFKNFRHMLGKRCSFKTQDGKFHQGIISFAGKNTHFGWYQVTVDRCPVRNADLSTLKLVKEHNY